MGARSRRARAVRGVIATFAAVISGSLTPACGRFILASHARQSTTTVTESVGAHLDLPRDVSQTTAFAPAPATTAKAFTSKAATATTRDVCLGPARSTPVNVETKDEAGVRLTLTVADKLCFAQGEPIRLGLGVKNISRGSVEYDSSQLAHFSITPRAGGVTWRDHACGKFDDPGDGSGPHTPLSLDPGEDANFVADYPGSEDTQRTCGGQSGIQTVSAWLILCDAHAGDGKDCTVGHTTRLTSAPITIRIGA